MFRQNASWQGMARWVEEEASEDFASTLELMYLIENSFDAYLSVIYNGAVKNTKSTFLISISGMVYFLQ